MTAVRSEHGRSSRQGGTRAMTEISVSSSASSRSAITRWLLRSAAVAVFAAVAVWQPASAYPILTHTPDPINAGDQVTPTLTDTLPPVDPILGGVEYLDLEITFDPTYLSLTGALLGNLLTGWNSPVLGTVNMNSSTSATVDVSVSECPTCTDAGGGPDSLVALVFESFATDPSVTDNVIVDVLPADIGAPNAYNFSSGAEVTDPVNIAGAAITSVPEPASGTLFLVGVAAILAFRQRLFPRRRAVPA